MSPRKHAPAVLLGAAASMMSMQALSSDDRSAVNLTSVSKAVAVTAVNSPQPDGCPIESPDGLSLLFASARPGGVAGNVGGATSSAASARSILPACIASHRGSCLSGSRKRRS